MMYCVDNFVPQNGKHLVASPQTERKKKFSKTKKQNSMCPTEKVLLKKFLFLNTNVRVAPCVECDVCKSLLSKPLEVWHNNSTETNSLKVVLTINKFAIDLNAHKATK